MSNYTESHPQELSVLGSEDYVAPSLTVPQEGPPLASPFVSGFLIYMLHLLQMPSSILGSQTTKRLFVV